MERKNGRKKMMILSFLVLSLVALGSDGGLGITTTFDKVIGIAQTIAKYSFMIGMIGIVGVGVTGRGGDGTLKYVCFITGGAFLVSHIEKVTDVLTLTSGAMF